MHNQLFFLGVFKPCEGLVSTILLNTELLLQEYSELDFCEPLINFILLAHSFITLFCVVILFVVTLFNIFLVNQY